MQKISKPCPLCGESNASFKVSISSTPQYEVDYGIPDDDYLRMIFLCNCCGVFINDHSLLPESFYQGEYNESTYGNYFQKRFEKIMSLPFENSDNKQRAARLHNFLQTNRRETPDVRILDIGSGLGVFSAEMLNYGYAVFAVDPDNRSVQHALNVIGVNNAWNNSIEKFADSFSGKKFDLLTLNKVLEHTEKPLHSLISVRPLLKENGYVYIELPDGEAAANAEGIISRQEFFIDHLTIYTPDSFQWLIKNAGLQTIETQRIHEPSGKYTIYALTKLIQ
ncbi:MAG: class I SAM-dependent methyltransferase [Desulfobacteraceae bacterium]|nr:class I SAM-dependent methyltransferase [Desulfobacteraceae bacterium]